jgi:hypothetical protein
MRWLGVLLLLTACEAPRAAPVPGNLSLVLDIPNGALDPMGFTSVEIVLHGPTGDTTRSVSVDPVSKTFRLDSIDPSASVSIEATLRSDTGAAVGYGRTAAGAALAGGTELVVPIRRPIAYIAGTISRDISTGTAPVLHWTQGPATFSDLSLGGAPDGKAKLGDQVVNMVAAGPSLYLLTQSTSDPTGALTGPARLAPVAMTDHQVGAMLGLTMTGGVLDSAGSDDGGTLVIGTTTQLYAVDTATGVARTLATGSFARVAIMMSDAGELTAIAIHNRGATTGACAPTAELWWAPLAAGAPARIVATAGFSDLATDRGRAYYVNACTTELGELTAEGTRALRTFTDPTLGRPTALAVSNGQAYVGFESQPATTSLAVAAIATGDRPRTLWTETARQILNVVVLPEVQRQLTATSVAVEHLQVGAGGDYVALTARARFRGIALPQVSYPEMTIDSEELRVFDAATGGTVQRYRSWCDGLVIIGPGDIRGWDCAASAGQSVAAAASYEHHINSMTFLFGKK